MIFLFTGRGVPLWLKSSQAIRENPEVLAYINAATEFRGMDLGAGEELTYRCYGCNRWSPIETATIDHISPKSQLVHHLVRNQRESIRSNLDTYSINAAGGSFDVYNMDTHERTRNVAFTVKGNDFEYTYESILHRIPIIEFLVNEPFNLTPMCAACNSKKSFWSITRGQFRPTKVNDAQVRVISF